MECLCIHPLSSTGCSTGRSYLPAALIVVFTERRCSVDDTCTVLYGYVVHACHEESFLVWLAERHELLVFCVFQIAALHFFKYLVVFLTQYLVLPAPLQDRRYCPHSSPSSHLHFDIVDVRAYCQSHVGSQRPRSSRPCQEVFVVCILFS